MHRTLHRDASMRWPLIGLHPCRLFMSQRRLHPVLLVALLLAPSHSMGAEAVSSETPGMPPAARASAEKALQYLGNRQAADGSFGTGYGQNVGVCGLAGLAFISSGSTPGRGPYGVQIDRCVDYILSHCRENGFIVESSSSSHGPMYGHGFATLFLAETYGMSSREDLRDKLAKAIQLIVDTQNEQGGWRYQPQRRDADLSVTICQVMALRAAKNSGIHVPNETIDRCVEYVKRSQNPDGGFMYMLDGSPSLFPRSAAGVVALYSAGIYEGPELRKGLAYLMTQRPGIAIMMQESHFFYGHYYAAQAMWHAGGDYWTQWYPGICEYLVSHQLHDGSWVNSISPEYGAAMAAIILQIPNNSLPILQR